MSCTACGHAARWPYKGGDCVVLKISVIVATVGRPELTRRTVDLLQDQSRPPDEIVVVSVTSADVEGVQRARGKVDVAFSPKGLPKQRNVGLSKIAQSTDVVVFFDDDFIPAPDYIENVEQLFATTPDLVGITGELIADGINTGGISFEDASQMASDGKPRATTLTESKWRTREALYGCNMAIRCTAAKGLLFDERLPLYGWLEDIDFTFQLSRRGRLVSTDMLTGVHMGVRGGRTSGKRLGYSQVANVLYLRKKGTMQRNLFKRLLFQNILSNILRSFNPEPHIDRRGRLIGNLLAISDLVRGKLDPARIESM